MHTLNCGRLVIDGPAVMGILNVTPDSFSDGGRFAAADAAVLQARAMIAQGAAIIDIGGESTRPGAGDVSADEELARVMPVLEALRADSRIPISIDTSKPEVMAAAVEAGADLINDVRALREPGAVEAVARLEVAVCLMHMQGQPRTMQQDPNYDDVTGEVARFLLERRDACVAAGIPPSRILFDPGFGFGKRPQHNVELLANLRQLENLGQPLLVGVSRKSTLGELTGRAVHERLAASLAAAVIAVMNGALIIRAHDVAETVDAMKIVQAVLESGEQQGLQE